MTTLMVLTGLLSGFVASMTGAFAGGGSSLILLPLLLTLFPGSYASLLTTTKVGATTMTLISGVFHHKRQKLDPLLLAVITATAVVGTALGTYLVQYQLNEVLFKQLMGATLLSAAIYLARQRKKGLKRGTEGKISLLVIVGTGVFSFGINILNGLFGGTGIFLTSFLVAVLHLSFIEAIAYTMVSYVVVNLLQTGYLLFTETIDISLTLSVTLGAILGGMVGTHLQYLKGNAKVRIAAIILMTLIGLRMLTASFLP